MPKKAIPPSFTPQRQSALASFVHEKKSKRIGEIRLDLIQPNPFQPRKNYPDAEIEELTESIQQQGLLQNLVCRVEPDGKYTLIAGHRRLLALQKLGKEVAPVSILENVSDQDLRILALIENLQRKNLHPVDEVRAIVQVIEQAGSQEQAAKLLHKPVGTIGGIAALHNLGSEILDVCLGVPDLTKNKLAQLVKLPVERRLAVAKALQTGNRPVIPATKSKSGSPAPNVFRFRAKTATEASFSFKLQFKKGNPTEDEIFDALNVIRQKLKSEVFSPASTENS
ncbi:MAG: ParB/RepB/Spo0J family partition protein [Acidobacteria bacterium]|nr:ParB/RepB/Spo0J family partition protein [Acidobacteriota bacterium]